jgi:hypothetical protein
LRKALLSRYPLVALVVACVALAVVAGPVWAEETEEDGDGLMNILTWIWTILLALATFGFLAVSGFFAFLCIYARNAKYSVLSIIATVLFIFLLYMVLFNCRMQDFMGFNWYPLITPFIIEVAIVAAIFIYLWKL